MKEDFLYYLWENRLLNGDLQTTEGAPITINATGYRNTDSGPDFLEARITIGETLWAGHVEMHVKTSDWHRHQHQFDKAYDNVILHVVYENDAETSSIPILELKGRFDETLYANYQQFIARQGWIPCEKSLCNIQKFTMLSWFDKVMVERLEQKASHIEKLLSNSKNDWEDTLYRLVMRYFGMKVNNEAFEYLSNILPFKTLLKHADNLTQVEAMLFGCAGFLEGEFTDDYPLLLRREFSVMKAKFNLLTMPATRWKFMRMRPSNFPTVRLAQLAQIIHKNGCVFSKILEAKNVADAKQLLKVTPSDYWTTHYRFDAASPKHQKSLGEETADILIINAIVPLLFCYGQKHYDETLCERASDFLEQIPAENNAITRHYAQCGWQAQSAMHSQAMIQLHDTYCKRKRCLECRIGNVLLK
ncbi:MAG: DUF2851 family protein [Bacteroidales bacterium]|nr:DUF2851 family protein [Bacteroidales bacterium]